MTKEQMDFYLSTKGQLCPYCKKAVFATDSVNPQNYDEIWQEVECRQCNNIWIDVYKLAKTQEIKNAK